MELGFRGAEGVLDATVSDEALMISGDLSIVDVSMVVQYDIKDMVQFLFRVNDPGEVTAGRNIPAGRPETRPGRGDSCAAANVRRWGGRRSPCRSCARYGGRR